MQEHLQEQPSDSHGAAPFLYFLGGIWMAWRRALDVRGTSV